MSAQDGAGAAGRAADVSGERTRYEGGCHCGAVRYRVEVEEHRLIECSCSICTKKGYLHLIVPKERFTLLRGADAVRIYTFGTHTAKHAFCTTCGIHAYYTPRSHPDGVSVNARCLEGDEDLLSRFTIVPFDGRHWEENVERIR